MVPHLSLGKSNHYPSQTCQQSITIMIATSQVMLGLTCARIERLINLYGYPNLWTALYQNHQIRTDQWQLIRHTDTHIIPED
jgi:hypothetical protein